jgi:hypothetical protein
MLDLRDHLLALGLFLLEFVLEIRQFPLEVDETALLGVLQLLYLVFQFPDRLRQVVALLFQLLEISLVPVDFVFDALEAGLESLATFPLGFELVALVLEVGDFLLELQKIFVRT